MPTNAERKLAREILFHSEQPCGLGVVGRRQLAWAKHVHTQPIGFATAGELVYELCYDGGVDPNGLDEAVDRLVRGEGLTIIYHQRWNEAIYREEHAFSVDGDHSGWVDKDRPVRRGGIQIRNTKGSLLIHRLFVMDLAKVVIEEQDDDFSC